MQTTEINEEMRRHRMPEKKKVFDNTNVFCLFWQTKFGIGKRWNVRMRITAIFSCGKSNII